MLTLTRELFPLRNTVLHIILTCLQPHQIQDCCHHWPKGPRDCLRLAKAQPCAISPNADVHIGWCTEGAKVVDICQRGDKLLEDEVAKVFKGKKISKGIAHPCTVSTSTLVTPYTPLVSDAEEAETTLKAGEPVKIQLGAQIDGFGSIVCDTVVVGSKKESLTGKPADLLLATYYANELLLRLITPPGLLAQGTDDEKKKAQAIKPYSQSKITQLLDKVAKSYDCTLVENTTCWMFDRNEIESKKKIILAPGEGSKGEGLPEVGEVWGIEVGLSTGTGKVKTLPQRPTLHRRTQTTYGLKRDTSRKTLSEVQKKFGTFPFSLRQLADERAGKVGVVECVRGGVIRQYEVIGSTDGEPVSRLFTTIGMYQVCRNDVAHVLTMIQL